MRKVRDNAKTTKEEVGEDMEGEGRAAVPDY